MRPTSSWRIYVSLIFCVSLVQCKVSKQISESTPISHELWDELLNRYVTTAGWVDYKGLQDNVDLLDDYLGILSNNHPNDKNWSEAEQMAFWINAYNAYTVDLILEHYPVESIKDIKRGLPFINSVWDIKFIKIEDRIYSLNNLEHGILRKYYDEPRIHFVINCASKSCPKLLNEAILPQHIEEQFERAAIQFINDPTRNRITKDSANVSKIFTWFKGDFTPGSQKLIDFLNHYAFEKTEPGTSIDFMDYDWTINDLRHETDP